MEDSNSNILRKAVTDLKDYVSLMADKLTLGILENLSKSISSVFSVFVATLLASIAFLFLSVALMLVLAQLLHSYIYSMLIMGGVFVIAAILVFINRDTLIANRIIRKFCNIIMDIKRCEK